MASCHSFEYMGYTADSIVRLIMGNGVEGDGVCEYIIVFLCHFAEGFSIVNAHFNDSSTDIMDPQLSNSPQ